MSTSSRLPIDPSTHLPSIDSFADISEFLRDAVADEESRLLSESMTKLSVHIEAIVAALRVNRQRTTVAPMLVEFLTALRANRILVVNLGLSWRGLYEYAAYLQALNHFRVLIGQWLLEGGPRSAELLLKPEDFELVAWRTLGEGLLLIDMYEQCSAQDAAEGSGPGPLEESQIERAMLWWKRLRI